MKYICKFGIGKNFLKILNAQINFKADNVLLDYIKI